MKWDGPSEWQSNDQNDGVSKEGRRKGERVGSRKRMEAGGCSMEFVSCIISYS